MTDVVVFGSANADLVLSVDRIPGPGETVLARRSARVAGGKGANQAVAAARSGADTAFLGALGADTDGELLREELGASGIDLARVRTSAEPTGLAVVTVGADAENAIVVAAGANATLDDLDEADRRLVSDTRVLLCQLEVPLAGVIAALRYARECGVRTILNAAPSRPLPQELLALVDLLVVNEHEAADLLEDPGAVADPDTAAIALLRLVPEVIITLGADGSRYAGRNGARLAVPAPTVEAVDTTAAGDTFCGVLAAALAQERPISEALDRATVAAALCVQRAGAVPSIPTAEEIDAGPVRGR